MVGKRVAGGDVTAMATKKTFSISSVRAERHPPKPIADSVR